MEKYLSCSTLNFCQIGLDVFLLLLMLQSILIEIDPAFIKVYLCVKKGLAYFQYSIIGMGQ